MVMPSHKLSSIERPGMTDNNQTEATSPAAEALQEAAQASIAKPDATSTTTASDELSADDLEAVAGGLTGGSFTSLDLSSLIGGPLKAPGI